MYLSSSDYNEFLSILEDIAGVFEESLCVWDSRNANCLIRWECNIEGTAFLDWSDDGHAVAMVNLDKIIVVYFKSDFSGVERSLEIPRHSFHNVSPFELLYKSLIF
jgi:hypothetical protein